MDQKVMSLFMSMATVHVTASQLMHKWYTQYEYSRIRKLHKGG